MAQAAHVNGQKSFASFLQKRRACFLQVTPLLDHWPMLVLGVIVLASFAASFSDWVFMDALIHRFYADAPEIWRPRGGTARIVVSQIIGTAATAALVLLCRLGHAPPFLAALCVWGAGPLPVIVQNVQWMKLHAAIGASHAAGWLARLLITATLYALLLTRP